MNVLVPLLALYLGYLLAGAVLSSLMLLHTVNADAKAAAADLDRELRELVREQVGAA